MSATPNYPCVDCGQPVSDPLENNPEWVRCLNADCVNYLTFRPADDTPTDAEVLEWLQEHYMAADFDYPQSTAGVLVIDLPVGVRVSANLRDTVQAILRAERAK